MKKYSLMLLSLCGLLTFTSCMDDHDDPNVENFLVTSPTSVGEVNTTIGAIKARYCASNEGVDYMRTSSNYYTKVKEDLIIEGVVVANDLSGNLYQTLIIRQLQDASVASDGKYTIDEYDKANDQCIQLKIKNTCLGMPGLMFCNQDVLKVDLYLSGKEPHMDFSAGILPRYAIPDAVKADEPFAGYAA